jgi:hypothetical protein
MFIPQRNTHAIDTNINKIHSAIISKDNDITFGLRYRYNQFSMSIFKDISIRCRWNIKKIQVYWDRAQIVDKEVPIICYTRYRFQYEFKFKLSQEIINNITDNDITTQHKMTLYETPIIQNLFIQNGIKFLQLKV